MSLSVALLYGGQGPEHNVSLMGYPYVKNLLEECGHRVLSVYVDEDGAWHKDDRGGALTRVVRRGGAYPADEKYITEADAAIPLLHGDGGESGEVQGALECAGVPYVGARVSASAACVDKAYAKRIVEGLGIPTAKWVSFCDSTDVKDALSICKASLRFPMFIKPRRLGSSVGASPVFNEEDFKKRFPIAMRLGRNLVIVEELIGEKRELECAFYSAGGVTKFSHAAEILCEGFYGYDEKYGGRTATTPRATLSKQDSERLREYCRLIASELLLRHLARIDFFLTPRGILFNEINTLPGFTDGSLYPQLLLEMGIEPRAALDAFVRDAISDARPL